MDFQRLLDYPKRVRFRRLMNRKVSVFGNAYLRNRGWHESFRIGDCVDKDGNPLPWITYPAIEMLRRVVTKQHKVFEYGCGSSSLWWAERAASVYSVEHHPAWADKIAPSAPSNLTVRNISAGEPPAFGSELLAEFFRRNPSLPLEESAAENIEHGFNCEDFRAYAGEIARFEPQTLDIVVVDGMARSLCAWMAMNSVKPDGLIVFDNADRPQYGPAFKAFSDLEFARIDFWGPAPFGTYQSCTSIFSKSLEWAKSRPEAAPALSC